jgi:DNA primase
VDKYRKQLWRSPKAIDYMLSRGISLDASAVWGIGYEPSNTTTRLRNRLIFPIRDIYGNTLAYQGRTLDPAVEPKYWHTSFDKGGTLYGVYEAGRRVVEANYVILAEGNIEPILCWQVGLPCVGTMGTAFTERQAVLLRRLTEHVVDGFDRDEHGRKAWGRISDMLRNADIEPYTINDFPEGCKDLADVYKKHGAEGVLNVY